MFETDDGCHRCLLTALIPEKEGGGCIPKKKMNWERMKKMLNKLEFSH